MSPDVSTAGLAPRDAADPAHVRFDSVRMAFGGRTVFASLSCDFPRGKITVILGGSGSGKSTMLRLIGGLVRPKAGKILIDGVDTTGLSERRLYDVRQKLGMMFQAGALLDSLTVYDNIAFPLREHTRMGEPEIAAAVRDRLTAVGLTNADRLYPRELSGGMLKRVALARAIIREPGVLLVDEPFSGLDPISTKRIEALLKHLNRERAITMIVVSHHIPSTMRMADQVMLILPFGVFTGPPGELARNPDARVTAFLDEQGEPAEYSAEVAENEIAQQAATGPRTGKW